MVPSLPLYLKGKVCEGYGRGSRELGIPTANYDKEVEQSLPSDMPCGVYFGWAQIDSSQVYKMVMNIGWCPFYKNEKRSVEVHIIHSFDKDFYDSTMKVVVLKYMRPEKNFSSVDELVSKIKDDISVAVHRLDDTVLFKYKHDQFFRQNTEISTSDCYICNGSSNIDQS